MTGADPAAPRRCVVVGGAGAVGRLFVDLLTGHGAEVTVVDPAAPETGPAAGAPTVADGPEQTAAPVPGVRMLAGDVTDVDQRLADELTRADLVLLAVPERVALAAVKPLDELLAPGALLVDTLSVKGRLVDALTGRFAGRQVLSLNPMFAPALGFPGRPVAAVVVRDGPRVRQLCRLIDAAGGRVVPVDAAQHDRLAGATQALTHAAVLGFGLALADLDVEVTELAALAPPPHAMLLALLARIASGTPEVYWDVQSANPQAPAARAALADGLRQLAGLVERGDETGFEAALDRLRGFLGPELDRYRDLCASTFATMTGR